MVSLCPLSVPLGCGHISEGETVPLCHEQDETIIQPLVREESEIIGSLND